MDPESGENLGHGVYASPVPDGELIVTSPSLDLEWRVAGGQAPGTAVLWREKPYEVIGRADIGQGARWTLRRWDEAAAMRGVFKLEANTVGEIASQVSIEAQGRRTRKATGPLLPILGLAPAGLQKKWADDWGLNSERATQVSAICEIIFGAVGIIQVAARAFAGEVFMPAWLAYLGVVLFASGCVRLALVAADGEPVGSVLGVLLMHWTPKPDPVATDTASAVRSIDTEAGTLVLESPIHRRDWDRDGVLPFRGENFRIERVENEGRSWVYSFAREDGNSGKDRILRLAPPPASQLPQIEADPASPSILRTMLVTAAVALGPAPDQERWSTVLEVRAVWFTFLGAGAELLGGIANLGNDLGSTHQILVLLDFYLVGEGLVRLGSALIGKPMGSIFGWALRPLYRHHLP